MSKICAGILGCLLLGWASQAVAKDSEAYQFAGQVGVIAGIAQACGKDVSVLVTRSQEAIAILAVDTNDSTLALSNLQKTMISQYNAQKANHALPCDQITPDYDGLPILKDDYKTEVLPKLKPQTTQAKTTPILPQTLTVVPGSLDMSKGTASAAAAAGQGAVTNIYIGPPPAAGANAAPQVSISTNNPNAPQLNGVYGAPINSNAVAALPPPNPFANSTTGPANPYTSATPNPLATATPNPYVSSAPNPIATAAPNPYASPAPNPIATATPNPYASPVGVPPPPSANAAPQPQQQVNNFVQTTPTQEYQQSITR
jgi:hypothetical protein